MAELDNTLDNTLVDQETSADLIGKKIKSIPVPEKNIGIDTDNEFFNDLAEAIEANSLDTTKLESFSQLSSNRNLLYNALDMMCQDSKMSAALELYAEDTTETNSDGHIMWATSDDAKISKYINFLLDEINVDKNIYKWVYSLCKYGDLYLRLYRESEYKRKLGIETDERKALNEAIEKLSNIDTISEEEKAKLIEDIKLKIYKPEDKYSHYVEMIPNPAEMFELIQLGKTYAYIQAPSSTASAIQEYNNNPYYTSYRYNFKRQDVNIYDATEFVHACLEDNAQRFPEEVQLSQENDKTEDANKSAMTFTVRKGQSVLYSGFRDWRLLTLLENSLTLNRLTKSSIIRIFNVQVGDMPKNNIKPYLNRVKQMIEQKTAINEGNYLQEYTNPGPMENTIYVPVRDDGQGTITTQEVGGNPDVKSIVDIDYFKNRLYSSLRIPKQFMGDTEDNTGFNGGTSLVQISSRYAKTIKRIQNTVIQALTDCVNLMLLDKGLSNYINKFVLHMVVPQTVEETERRQNLDSYVGVINNIMSLLDNVEDASNRLRILKALLSDVLDDQEIMDIIQEEIDRYEDQEEEGVDTTDEEDDFEFNAGAFHEPAGAMPDIENNIDISAPEESGEETSAEETVGELPSASDLGVDMTSMDIEG